MSARKKRWVLREPAPPQFLAAARGHSPLLATLLYQRGLRDRASIEAFLAADYKAGLHDPFLLKGMAAAADRVAAAIRHGEPIAVYGDFDTDGVTAVALLKQAITAMGGDIQPYIPHRLREGYGLNTEAIDTLAASGIRLLITVDCGISNAREVAHARGRGLDVVVTDHHTPPETLPDAVAVVNPKQPGCPYPDKGLVGVGIAYKLVQALVRRGFRPPLRKEDLLDVVALGTVADMGPLTGENRVLVKAGLDAINTTRRPGLRALILAAGLRPGAITAADIGYGLAPRLNAAGRLDDAVRAYELLLAEDDATAHMLAAELSQANRRRQDLTKELQQAARAHAEQLGKHTNRIVVLDGAEYQAGIVGLVASRLVEDLGRPVLLVERGERTSRGSARSVPGFSIVDALASCQDILVRYGGHAAAAGFTIETAHLAALEARLLAYAAEHLKDELLTPAIEIDAEAPLDALSWDLLEQLNTLEPFGQANPQPVLLARRVRVAGAWARGNEGQHLKLRLDDGNGGAPFDAMAFRLGALAEHLQRPRYIDIAFTLERNDWNGSSSLQLIIKDFRRAQP
ncbi:MAG TPA: single-stranded-DNA-specific exonuclease RecJ [Roseiflexaceae bacterium]|nr:single-stranded-DNA-specific exonuclease RecJ [Roseiflexaceae bacterium]